MNKPVNISGVAIFVNMDNEKNKFILQIIASCLLTLYIEINQIQICTQ